MLVTHDSRVAAYAGRGIVMRETPDCRWGGASLTLLSLLVSLPAVRRLMRTEELRYE
ncbi:hypothetical protein [Actinoplanes sp. TFC3]|uniref:hypothetical protein n=1 Tax=Actinoplanes sp. TFC3 TaxID=1710355 RepID=UPI000B0FBFD4|nr:hypothetical protein [Actinoplanes sp. TFC3]